MKIFLKILGAVIVIILALVVAFPYIASTDWARRRIEESAEGELKIDKLTLSWTSGQTIKGFSYTNPGKTTQVRFKELTTPDSLLTFLLSGFSLDELKIKSPEITIAQQTNARSKVSAVSLVPLLYLKHLEIDQGMLSLRQGSATPLQFSDIDATLLFPGRGKPLSIKLFTKTREGSETGIVRINSQLTFDPHKWKETLSCRLDALVQNFPLKGIDRFIMSSNPQYSNLLSGSIGKVLNFKGKASLSKKFYDIQASIDSDYIRGEIDTKNQSRPANLSWTITPVAYNLLASKESKLKNSCRLDLALQSFKIPSKNGALVLPALASSMQARLSPFELELSDGTRLQVADFSTEITSDNIQKSVHFKTTSNNVYNDFAFPILAQGKFLDLLSPKDIQMSLDSRGAKFANILYIDELNLNFTGKDLSDLAFKGILDVNPNQDNVYTALLGKELKSKLKGNLSIGPKGALSMPYFSFKTLSNYLQAKFKAKASRNFDRIEITSPINISYNVNPKRLMPIREKLNTDFLLKKKSPIYVTVEPFDYDRSRVGRELSYLKARLFTEDFQLEDVALGEVVTIDELHALLTYDPKERDFDAKIDGVLASDERIKGNVNVEMSVREIDWSSLGEVGVNLAVQATNLPSKFLPPILNINPVAPEIIGKSVDLSTNFVISKGAKECKVRLDAPLLHVSGALDFQNELRLSGRTPLKIDWTITPEGYQALNHIDPGEIAKPVYFAFNQAADFSLYLERLSWPLDHSKERLLPSISHDYAKGALKGSLKVNNLSIKDVESGVMARARSSKFLLDKRPKDALHFDIDSRIETQASSGSSVQSGSIDGSGMILIPMKNGAPSYKELEASSMLKVSHLPSMLLDALFRTLKWGTIPPSAVLGDDVNATGKVHVKNQNGTIALKVDASEAKMDLDGAIIGGKLMLKRPLTAAVNLTQRFDSILFNQFDIYAVRSRRPIRLAVDYKGFIVPLTDFNVSRVQIPNMQLDLGKLRFYNRGNVRLMGDIFKIEDLDMTELWFAPLDLHLARGILDVERTEILYDNRYHICTWGEVNLSRRFVDLIIGLTAQSLRSGLGLSGLPNGYVMKVPFKGPFGNVKIDKGAVLAKIALMIAQRSAGDNLGVFGGILDVVQGAVDDQSDVPPPKQPYPWGNQISSRGEVGEIPIKHKTKRRKKAREIFDYSLPVETFTFPEVE